MTARRRLHSPGLSGLLDVAPILIGVVPFALIAGIAAVEAGFGSVQAIAMSPLVFAGASQLAIADLVARDAAPIVVVATALAINARFLMYSAALAPTFRSLAPHRKAYAAFLITDQAFAVSAVRFAQRDESLEDRFAYFLGAALGLWTTWQVSSLAGVLIGAGVPPEWSLDFAIPLVFIALLVPAITDRGTGIAATVSGVGAVAFVSLPLNLGLLAASVLGLAAGAVGKRR